MIAILLISIPLTYLYLNSDDGQEEDSGITLLSVETEDLKGNISSKLTINSLEFFKGENISGTLDLEVENSVINLYWISVTVEDIQFGKNATQSVLINNQYEIGVYSISFDLLPGFSENGFLALTAKNYRVVAYSLTYMQNQQVFQETNELNIDFSGRIKPVYEQLNNQQWEIDQETNVTIQATGQLLQVVAADVNGSASLHSTIKTTAYPRLYYNITGLQNSSIDVEIGDTAFSITNSQGYLSIGNIFNQVNLSLNIIIRDSENLNVSLSLPTQQVPVLAIVATNNWEGLSDDNFIFRDASYYIKQASDRFEQIMNLTLIPVVEISFTSNAKSNLLFLRTDAISQTGTKLELDLGFPERWLAGPGTQPENLGADILLVMTNKTMEYLGIVVGENGQAYNVAVHARGSENGGQYRLPSVFADNLIQHEVSHIFGAPDRFTNSDPPSIMSKSQLNDAFRDIANGDFWLMRVDWLEIDIQTMYDNIFLYL